MTKILVTGASGYIAKHIVLLLLRAGYQVRASVRSPQRADQVRAAMQAHLSSHIDLEKALSFVELDLNADAGWTAAMEEIDTLIHTASPFPYAPPDSEDELIRPAVDGTLRALKAAAQKGVRRVIMTSSTAAVVYGDGPEPGASFDESHWTDVNHPTCSAYSKSKTLAEQAAWEFIANEAPEINLTCINPGLVLGAPLDNYYGTSMRVIARLMAARDPAVPRLGFSGVDIRDVATAHVEAISRQATFGKRILVVSGFLWFREIAVAVKSAFPQHRIATREAPNWLIRFLGLFSSQIRGIVPLLGVQFKISNRRARDLLDMEFSDPRKSAVESAKFISNRIHK